MSSSICFTCGQAVGDPPRLNRTASGQVCPSCRDRLLDALPALLPGMPVHAGPARGMEGADAADPIGAPVEPEAAGCERDPSERQTYDTD